MTNLYFVIPEGCDFASMVIYAGNEVEAGDIAESNGVDLNDYSIVLKKEDVHTIQGEEPTHGME